jgi:hypothetical protein
LVVCNAEAHSGEAIDGVEMRYPGSWVIASRSLFGKGEPTDKEARDFLACLPEAGLDLSKPLQEWTTYLDWRQKLAERKANEGYAYRGFRIHSDGLTVGFQLAEPNVRELLKTRLSGESIRVFCGDKITTSDQGDEAPPTPVLEGAFRSVDSKRQEPSVSGQGSYALRRNGKPKADAELLTLRVTIDAKDERSMAAIRDLAETGILKAAMEGELAAVDVQRHGLRRLAEFQSQNPNVRRWLFDPKAATPISSDPVMFAPDLKLNEEQLECVRRSLALTDLLLLWGPPGTGKTTVIAEIASQYCRLGGRVLISSQGNLAVDEALKRLPQLPHIRPVRISTSKQKSKLGIDSRAGMLWWLRALAKAGTETLKRESDPRWRGILQGWTEHLTNKVALTDLSEPSVRHYKLHANVVGATCSETGKVDFYAGNGFNGKFDLSIVDEVSKATPPELLLPALLGKRTLLVGDHRQLPPVFRESTFPEMIANGELSESEVQRYERMVTASRFEHLFDECDPSLRVGLRQQYRMHPQIMRAVNSFYADQPLAPGGGEPWLIKEKSHAFSLHGADGARWLKPGHHLVWIDSSYDADGRPARDEQIGTSRLNDAEAVLGVELLRGLLPQTDSIGFISLYRAQIQNIERLLSEESDPKLRDFLEKRAVNTVDQFQGCEREIIIVSLTRTDPSLTGEFIKDFRRINVAISRAQKLLILIGRRETFDSGMVEVPRAEGKGREARAVYREIRELAIRIGLFLPLQRVIARGPNPSEAKSPPQPARLNEPFSALDRHMLQGPRNKKP